MKQMQNRANRILIISLLAVSILCIGIFSFVANYMNTKSESAIYDIGEVYMSGVSEQIANHFETMIDLRLDLVESLYEVINDNMDEETLRRSLAYSARSRDFDSLAFYDSEGNLSMIYGVQSEPINQETFLEAIKNGKKRFW